MKNLFARFALTLALGSLLTSVRAVILPVAEDTSSTVAGKINETTGKAVTLSVTSRQQAFLSFDLSTLPATVTASNVTSARLNLYVSSLVTAGDLTVHTVTNAWQELTAPVTAPGYSSEVVGTIPAADLVAKKFVEVDVTVAVSNWLSGASNCGFAIATAAGNLRLASKEGLGTGFPALLEIESSNGSIYFSGGNVGIGTATPVTELQVSGTVTATSFTGNGAGLTNLSGAALTGLPNLEQIALLKWSVSSADNTFTVGTAPIGLCFDGTSIWVANTGGSSTTVTKLAASTGATIGTYTVGSQPEGICFDGASIWVANFGNNNVTKLNASTGAASGPYSVGTGPAGICFDGASIWVANNNSGTVTKLNTNTGATIGTYTVGSEADAICFDGASIWVANNLSGTLTKLNASTGATLGTYIVGSFPHALCFDGASIWVANAGSGDVTKLNASTGATIGTYSVGIGSNPEGICFDGASIWVSNWGGASGTTVTKL